MNRVKSGYRVSDSEWIRICNPEVNESLAAFGDIAEVNRNSPDWLKEIIAGMDRCCAHEFDLYPHWHFIDSPNDKGERIGFIFIENKHAVGMSIFYQPFAHKVWYMSGIWIIPSARRMNVLTKHSRFLWEKFGYDFSVVYPLSEGVKAWIKQSEWAPCWLYNIDWKTGEFI